MGLFSGLEKFGFNIKGIKNIYEDPAEEKAEEKAEAKVVKKEEEKPPEEKDFLVLKYVTCPVCNLKFR